MNFWHVIKLFFSFILISFSLYSQEKTAKDTLSIIVVKDSILSLVSRSPGKIIFQADSLGFFTTSAKTADEVLQNAEGVYIRNYGGHGGVKTVSLRGFGSNQTSVSINNIPYENTLIGSVNFGNFQTDGSSTVNVSSGSPSASSNSLAGNINLQFEPGRTVKKTELFGGSFGERGGSFQTRFNAKPLQTGISISYIAADDEYPYELYGIKANREHAFFEQIQYKCFISGTTPEPVLSFGCVGFFSYNQIPGPVVTGYQNTGNETLKQQDHFYYLNITPKQSNTSFSVSHHYSYSDYLFIGKNQFITTNHFMGQGMRKDSLLGFAINSNLQYAWQGISGNALNSEGNESGIITRNRLDGGIEARKLLSWNQSFWLMSLYGRINAVTEFGILGNGGIRLEYYPAKFKSVVLYGQSSQSHRIPTFSELYYTNYGNPLLKPENCLSADGGIYFRPKFSLLNYIKLSGFYNATQNKIISIPLSPVRWSTRSEGYTETLGFEWVLGGRILKGISWEYRYTFTNALSYLPTGPKLLPYTPKEVAGGSIIWTSKTCQVGTTITYSGWRFILTRNQSEDLLSGYFSSHAWIRKSFTKKGLTHVFQISAENLLNQQYQVIKSYPMPGISFRASYSLIFL